MKHFFVILSYLLLITSCTKDILIEEDIPLVKNLDASTSGKILVSHHTLNADYLDHTWKNHKKYAEKHNYDYWFRNGKIDNNKFSEQVSNKITHRYALFWQKLTAVIDAMSIKLPNNKEKYDWIMWVDADAFFTDQAKKIENIISDLDANTFFAVSQDYPNGTCVNAGIWLVRNNKRGREFMNNWANMYAKYKKNPYPEQMALQSLIYQHVKESDIASGNFPEYKNKPCNETQVLAGTKVFPQRILSAYYTEYAISTQSAAWKPGDYIAHVAGSKNKLKLITRLMTCMEANQPDLIGCEVNGSWEK